MNPIKAIIPCCLVCGAALPAAAQQMVTKHLSDFATPGGGGYPDDDINDHQAFVNAAAFFQERNGYGTLVLGDGEYIIGAQQLRNGNDSSVADGWWTTRYPQGAASLPTCQSLVAWQQGFVLDSCFNSRSWAASGPGSATAIASTTAPSCAIR